MTIYPPDETMDINQNSMTSPIVINDKMLSHASVASTASFPLRNLLTQNNMEIYRTIQNGVTERQLDNDPCSSFIDSDAITSIFMDLNEKDYEVNIPVNELLKMT